MEYADTNIPVEMDRFWTSNKNKELYEVLSRNYFASLALKGYIDNGYGAYPCVKVQDGKTEPCEGLKSYIEEADERIILHIAQAAKDAYQ